MVATVFLAIVVATIEVIVDVVDVATVIVVAGSGYFDEQKDSAGPKLAGNDLKNAVAWRGS